MTQSKYNAGDEVWVRGRVSEASTDGVVVGVYVPDCAPLGDEGRDALVLPFDFDIRTEADFLDSLEPEEPKPLDQAKVTIQVSEIPFSGESTQASFWRGAADRLEGGFISADVSASVVRLLRTVGDAIQAKLDSEKIKTAEDVAAEAFDITLPVAEAPKAIVAALRSAAMLKEDGDS